MNNQNNSDGKVSEGSFGELVIDHGDKRKPASKNVQDHKTAHPVEKASFKQAKTTNLDNVPELIYEKSTVDTKLTNEPALLPSVEPILTNALPSDNFNETTSLDRKVSQSPVSQEPPLRDMYEEPANAEVYDDKNLVPGGFMTGVPNPQAFFKSRYRSHRQNNTGHSGSEGPQPSVMSTTHGLPVQPLAMPAQPVLAKPRIPLRLPFVIGVVLLLIFGLIFLVYQLLGNSPERIYGQGMSRTGQALEKLNSEIFSSQTGARIASSSISGSVSVKYQGEETSSLFEGSIEDGVFKIKGEGTAASAGQQKNISYSLYSAKGSTSLTPQLFFNPGPSPSLSSDYVAPAVSSRPGAWFLSEESTTKAVVDRLFLSASSIFPPGIITGERVAPSYESVSSEAVSGSLGLVIQSAKDYIFTSKDKGIFSYREFVGQDEQDDLELNHYSVGINKNKYVEFCADIKTRLGSEQQILSALLGISPDTLTDLSSCETAANELPEDMVVDIWIGSKQKILHKIRVYYSDNLTSYREFGQTTKADRSVEFYYIDNDALQGVTTNVTMWYEFETSRLGLGYTESTVTGNELMVKLNVAPGDLHVIDIAQPDGTVSLGQFLSSQGKSPADLLRISR